MSFFNISKQRQRFLPSRSVDAAAGGLRPGILSKLQFRQKYTLKRHQTLLNEMTRIYPSLRDFVDSTAVSRLNGYAGGHGAGDQLSREIDSLGLSAEGKKRLADLVRR